MDDRKQLSGLFANSPELFHTKVSFREAFPEVRDFRLEVTTENSYNYEDSTSVYTITNVPGEYVDCNKSNCYRGGFSFGDLVRRAVRERMSFYEGVEICRGYESSGKGRDPHRSCSKAFRVKLSVTFHEEPEPAEAASDI